MAKFELGEGEHVVGEFEVSLIEARETRPARIILTNDRLVVVTGMKVNKWPMWFTGLYSFALRGLLRGAAAQLASKITYQIARERFASVEPGEGRVIVFHDDGEGYAHTSFAIMSELLSSQESVTTWQQRMQTWAAGTATMPLPQAKLHNSRN